jgi:hypothetical protein
MPRTPKQERNDARIVEQASLLTNMNAMRVHGAEGLQGITAGIRRRVSRMNGGTTPVQEAWICVRQGDLEGAKAKFLLCLDGANGDIEDPRFFSVYWGLGKIAEEQQDLLTALQYFKLGIEKFPGQSREEHFVTVATLILQANPQAETEAAAVVQQGIDRLNINPAATEQAKGKRLLDWHRKLERRNTGEVRPSFPSAYLG